MHRSNRNLLTALREATERGIIGDQSDTVYFRTRQYGWLCHRSCTGRSRRDHGGFDMTFEAALTKLHYLLSQDYTSDEIRILMQQDSARRAEPDNDN